MRKISILTAAAVMLAQPVLAEEQVLKVGVDAEPYPPFTVDQADGRLTGFEVELLDAYCAEMKVKCQIERVGWDGIIPALLSGKIDMIVSSMSISDERKKVIDFSDPYYQNEAVVVAPKNVDMAATPEGLAGKLVGVKAGTIHANYAEKRLAGSTVRVYPSQDEVNSELVNGRIDAAIDDMLPMSEFIKTPRAAKLAIKGAIDDPLVGSGVGAGLRKEDVSLKEKVNKAIAAVAGDGRYQQLMKKYFQVDISPKH